MNSTKLSLIDAIDCRGAAKLHNKARATAAKMRVRTVLPLLHAIAAYAKPKTADSYANISGVPLWGQQHYVNGYRCADGTIIPRARVNDDACDCVAGGDEPGTAACAGRQQFFWCAADRRFIPSSRVGDGVVDCCDGADETMRNAPPTGPRLMPRCPASHDEVTTFQKGAARRRERFGGRTISDALSGQCVEKTLVPFTYVLCFGSRAEQREGGERRSLGDARAFDTVSRTWRHEGGDACPGDVARSATVEIECSAGPSDYEILAVDEVSMCVYHIRVASPAGCDEARREELGPRLDAVEDDGSPRIVNGWLLTRGERGEGMWYHVGTAATQLFAPEGWF